MKAEVPMKPVLQKHLVKAMSPPPEAFLPKANGRVSDRLQVRRRLRWSADLTIDEFLRVRLPQTKHSGQVAALVAVNTPGARFAKPNPILRRTSRLRGEARVIPRTTR